MIINLELVNNYNSYLSILNVSRELSKRRKVISYYGAEGYGIPFYAKSYQNNSKLTSYYCSLFGWNNLPFIWIQVILDVQHSIYKREPVMFSKVFYL